tara:strand:+ start:1363 stop:1941 length:579 start_codon:yes stop_codon:yes gene_type:complete
MATLRPFRQISENDVVNLYAFDYSGTAITKGHIVKLRSDRGWDAGDEFLTESINNSYSNTVSDRYALNSRVQTCTSGDTPFGMLMYDVAEVDENGEKLIWHPRKAHEMQTALSGQAVPVLTRGIVLVNGVTVYGGETVAAGTALYAGDDGAIITQTAASVQNLVKLGTALGPATAAASEIGNPGDVLIKLEL